MPRTILAGLPIIIDTREQLPYAFPGAVRATLATGDYSLAGYESRVAVERKSFDDFYGCVGRGRDRFREQIKRLGALEYGALVIEADIATILAGHQLSRVHPAAAIGTLVSWAVRYRVQVWLAGCREHGRAIVYRILDHWARHNAPELAGVK